MCVSTKLQPHRMAVYVRLSFCPSFHLSFFPMLLCSFCQSVRPSVVPSFLISVFHVLLRSSYFLPPFSPVIYFVPSFTPSFSPDFLRSFFPSIICHSVCLFVCLFCLPLHSEVLCALLGGDLFRLHKGIEHHKCTKWLYKCRGLYIAHHPM